MILSEHRQLENEYHEWLNERVDAGIPTVDCPLSVISFLDSRGLLREVTPENRVELRFVNATPDPLYPSRVLQAYIETGRVSDNTLGLPAQSPVIIMMNELQERRNSLLREALAKLSV